ncbi:hypothetical protein BGZ76_008478 [Entomortierella beljakovae]|nr:hypothetical protein BGZ76_008478 [Entomortierella beljakovae]
MKSESEVPPPYDTESVIEALRQQVQQLEEKLRVRNDPHVKEQKTPHILHPYDELVKHIPTISGRNFYHADGASMINMLPDMNSFYINNAMPYRAPTRSEITTRKRSKKFVVDLDGDLVDIQEQLAQITRPIDTLAHELVKSGMADQNFCKQTMITLRTIRVMLERTTARITVLREAGFHNNIY